MSKNRMKIKRYYGASVIGWCITCGKDFQNHTKRRQSYEHAKSTGHKVIVEISINFHYN